VTPVGLAPALTASDLAEPEVCLDAKDDRGQTSSPAHLRGVRDDNSEHRHGDEVDREPARRIPSATGDSFDLRRGTVRVIMFGNGSECSVAVAKHVKSMLPNNPDR
jgi:hypothetical protein